MMTTIVVRFRERARQAIYDESPELLLSGPAGTGKSRIALTKLDLLCSQYPGIRCLILRKTRESLSQSALVTYEEEVLGHLPRSHPVLHGAQRASRKEYRYPNGSTIIVAGIYSHGRNEAASIMSMEFDIVYVQEAIELTEGEWEVLTTRLRNNKMPYQQIIGDTNPSSPDHWLYKRCLSGRTKLIETRHTDNPALYDDDGNRTPFGETYLARLDHLTGVRKERLYRGRWVSAEGTIYEMFRQEQILDELAIPASWSRFCTVDFGFTNPFVCQWWAVDGDSRLYLYREIYYSQRLVEDHARHLLALMGYEMQGTRRVNVSPEPEPLPEALVCDHDAEGRATLERYTGLRTSPADKSVIAGIEQTQSQMRQRADGTYGVYFLRNSLVEVDPSLQERKLPLCTVDELPGYVWDTARAIKEAPVKLNDHGMDAMRYAVMYLRCRSAWRPEAIRTA